MTRRLLAIFTLAIATAMAAGQPAVASMPPGSKLYVAPMEWGLDRFVTAQITRQALPVELVSRQDQADFVMTSLYQQLGSHLLSPGHFIQVQVTATGSGRSIWADEVNDFAVVFGRLRPHGPARAAQAIVKKLRNKLFGAR